MASDLDIESRLVARGPADIARLTTDERDRYFAHGRRLIEQTRWEGARGFEVSNDMVDTIAAYGALLGAGFDPDLKPFNDVTTIIVHATTIVTTGSKPTAAFDGVYTDSPQYLAGLSEHGRGPLLFDWRTVRDEVSNPYSSTNVVYHEFAHKLDQLDGAADGIPPLDTDEEIAAWDQTIGTNFRRLQRRGATGIVRAYGATNQAEYFAVVSESFFARPVQLRDELPRVYERFAAFYKQDPAGRAGT